MTDPKNPPKVARIPAPGTVAAQVRATVDRLEIDEPRAAAYFGVPVFTVRKWLTGEREPVASVARLLEVLGMVEALAPALHASFLPTESRHVEKSGRRRSTGSTPDPVMSENPIEKGQPQ